MKQQKLALWAIWSAFFLSLFVYLGVALLGIGNAPSDPGFVRLMAIGLGLVACPTASATFILRKFLLTRPIAEGRLDPTTQEGAQRIQSLCGFTWALCEAVGIWGFVLWFLSSRWDFLLTFLGVSAFLLILHAPRSFRFRRTPTLEDLASGHGTIG